MLSRKEKESMAQVESKTSTTAAKISGGLTAGPIQVIRRSEKQALSSLGIVERLIEKEMAKSKREKTKQQLKSQLKICLTWQGWAHILLKVPARARSCFERASQVSGDEMALLEFGVFILDSGGESQNASLDFSLCSELSSSTNSRPAIKKIDLLKMVHNCHEQMILHPEQVKELIEELGPQD